MKELSILSIFVTLFGAMMLMVHIVFRILLRHSAAQGIYPDYDAGWLRFIGWLGAVVLIVGIALIVAERRGKGVEK